MEKKLKDKEAQKLREQVKVVVDGVEINLWQYSTFSNVATHEGWNKVKSFTRLNSLTDGINGDLVFSGVFQIPRKEVLEYAVRLGFKVHQNVSKNTDFVIVGSDNVSPSKVSKALKLNKEEGVDIKFIDENTFLSIVEENLFTDIEFDNDLVKEDYKLTKVEKQQTKTKIRTKPETISSKLEGLTFVVSGVFSLFSRDELKNIIEQNGGKVAGSISKKTSYIVAGENMGPSKLQKAQELGVEIIDENKFCEMVK